MASNLITLSDRTSHRCSTGAIPPSVTRMVRDPAVAKTPVSVGCFQTRPSTSTRAPEGTEVMTTLPADRTFASTTRGGKSVPAGVLPRPQRKSAIAHRVTLSASSPLKPRGASSLRTSRFMSFCRTRSDLSTTSQTADDFKKTFLSIPAMTPFSPVTRAPLDSHRSPRQACGTADTRHPCVLCPSSRLSACLCRDRTREAVPAC